MRYFMNKSATKKKKIELCPRLLTEVDKSENK